MMDWMQFLEGVAIDCELTPDQKRAFLARFDLQYADEKEKWIANNVKDERGRLVFAGEAAFKKLMTAVYRAVQRELFPELEHVAKGKKEKLEAFLRESWRKAPQPPILGEPSQEAAVTTMVSRSGLEPRVLMHGIPFLPDNYVVRSDELIAVKAMLLGTTDRSKVSAIVGMGGLGKSLLAAKLVEDEEIQRRFENGILWVTLGQNPESLLQRKLGELIDVLDKSRDSFSATTLGTTSQYLDSLLSDKRMLLVVDDVWDEHHLKWFRVGGSECRILLTTRLNSLDAIKHPLKVMSWDEAQMLIKNELRDKWTAEMEEPARSFSKSLGYLPLALQLMAVQVRRGRSWEYLNKALSEKSKRLRALNRHDVKLAKLSEEEQREYSLQACLQLSLRWLEPEQLSNFTWLGVLPEDATIRQGMAIVLWDVADWEAEEGLLALYESSLLTRGADTWDGEATYRVHDLLHALAKELIEQSRSIVGNDTLIGLGLSFADAQAQFLERYRGRSIDGSWYGLKNDGYIHRHLTWHLEMAGRCDEVHELMASGEDQNDWFEACDRIGQPGIFVEDVRRGWRLAEELYDRDRERAIVLQCRYALITGTLNSLVGNLPVDGNYSGLKH